MNSNHLTLLKKVKWSIVTFFFAFTIAVSALILSVLKTLHQLSERLAGKWVQFNFAQLPLNEETLAKMPIGLAQQLHMIKAERKALSDIGLGESVSRLQLQSRWQLLRIHCTV